MSTSREHAIRLAGPWGVRAEQAGTGEWMETTVRISSPDDWPGDWLAAGGPFSGKVVLKRVFHWTFPDPPPARVELVVDGLPPTRVWLNGKPMARRDQVPDFRCPVTRYLEPENVLELEYELDGFGPSDPFVREVQLIAQGG
jgi:hypothetical protein